MNASRGGLADEIALRRYLDEGHLSGAALDVFESEPVPMFLQVLKSRDLILTPHIVDLSEE
ncbi:NAD(P)-dependent oxidoreductase [Burkholderia sp. A9]|uniref:NAD(P)-dependent oxidoreductase n=1 Tax=Burkholderia sp. A9 TaxID=1365108 RepID=UPI003FA44512